MLGYKIAKSSGTRVLVTLEIPSDARTNITRCDIVNTQYAKHRCDRALVMSIEDSEGNRYCTATSSEYLKKQLVYTTGQIVHEPDYNLDPETVCGEGIHFFLNKEVALTYNILDYAKDNRVYQECDYKSPLKLEIQCVNKVPDGTAKSWHSNGNVAQEFNFSNGKLHGEYKRWYPNGQLSEQYMYKNDKVHGLYMKWNHTGTLILKCDYTDGILDGDYTEYYAQDNAVDCNLQSICRQGTFTHGKRNGEFKSWHYNDNPHLFCTYKDEKLHGKYTGWHLNGTLHTNCFYISDKLVSEDDFEKYALD
jgi:antitoxin component YwqK of YwqJK toxin-antitoxin module